MMARAARGHHRYGDVNARIGIPRRLWLSSPISMISAPFYRSLLRCVSDTYQREHRLQMTEKSRRFRGARAA